MANNSCPGREYPYGYFWAYTLWNPALLSWMVPICPNDLEPWKILPANTPYHPLAMQNLQVLFSASSRSVSIAQSRALSGMARSWAIHWTPIMGSSQYTEMHDEHTLYLERGYSILKSPEGPWPASCWYVGTVQECAPAQYMQEHMFIQYSV